MNITRKILLGLFMLITACSPVETGRRIAGTSIKTLEEEEKGRFSGIARAGILKSYAAVKEILEEKDLYIYLDNPENGYLTAMWFNRIYPRCIDTSEVGFFFQEDGPGRTRIDVVSRNSSLARFAAEMVFEELNRRDGIKMKPQ
ncbi:MAG: hypothetical protein RAO92_01075 [Candidatus Euphemobacter frigidus]|nr:hypothetical protein [Candidatus Euphemobacter frigidus]MDP8274971.1 hypothetical protein [Candidatus Euphemobacter frigidus]